MKNDNKIILIDIGNTYSKYTLIENDKFKYIRCTKTIIVDELIFSLLDGKYDIIISCVVPRIFEKFKDKKIFWIDHTKKLSFDLSLVKKNELGADRIANLESLASLNNLPSMIIDCGTAITIEVLNEEKIFLGGIIGPGRELMRKSLNTQINSLPMIPVHNTYLYKSCGKFKSKDEINISFGRDTVDSIILGTDVGFIGAIKEYIYITKKMLNIKKINMYAMGGDKNILIGHFKNLNVLPDDFTLKGIYKIWKLNNVQ